MQLCLLPEAKKIGRRHGECGKTGEKGGGERRWGPVGSRSKLIMMCYVCVGVCGSHINPAISQEVIICLCDCVFVRTTLTLISQALSSSPCVVLHIRRVCERPFRCMTESHLNCTHLCNTYHLLPSVKSLKILGFLTFLLSPPAAEKGSMHFIFLLVLFSSCPSIVFSALHPSFLAPFIFSPL